MTRTHFAPHARLVVALFALAAGVTTRPAGAQTSTAGLATAARTLTRNGSAALVPKPPVVDGHLDDDAWGAAQPLDGFVQRELHEGAPVTERTEVRLVTDGEALYVGAWLYDREPAGIVPGEKVRDVMLTNSDFFAIVLDTYLDRQNGFLFATTPAGVEYDGQVVKEGEGGGITVSGQSRAVSGSMGGFNLNWDGSWSVATSRDSLGWYAEFRIPFSTLRYGGGATQTWGLNLTRGIRRRNEEAYWSFVPRQFGLYRISRAGTLRGLSVPARRVATITPYVLTGAQKNWLLDSTTLIRSVDSRTPTEFGADLKYGLTPSLTLDLTYNTDFAQVEIDEQRTNLTRFPLFFPEKRPFFLENAGIFSAGTPQQAELFFSRRIGIDTLGTPVPIIGGGRVTGRAGGLTLGLLQIFTERTAGVQPAESWSVARAAREFSTHSRIGVIGIERLSTDSSADRNFTGAVDGRLGLGEAWTVDWWGAGTATPNRPGDALGYSVRAGYQTARWNNTFRTSQVGSNFNPEVGFLNRDGGFRYYEFALMRLIRHPDWPWFKEWNPHGSFRGYYGLDGFYQSSRIHLDLTEIAFANGGRLGPEFNIDHEGLQQPFAITDADTVPVGSYDFGSLGLDWETNPAASLAVNFRGDVGRFYNGTKNGGSATVTLRRGASLTTSLLLDLNDVHLAQGDFTRTLIGYRLAYFFTPRLFVQSLTQYSNQARAWTANARVGWLNTAGTGLFLVVNEGQEADGFFNWVRPQSRSVVLKYTRQFGTGG